MKTLQNNKGSVLIEYLVGFFIAMMCIAFALAVLPVFTTKAKLDNAADKILRTAERNGTTNVAMVIDEVKADKGLDFTVSWSGTENISGTQKVQLGDTIKLTLTTSHNINFFTFAAPPVQITVRAVGTSEKYHK